MDAIRVGSHKKGAVAEILDGDPGIHGLLLVFAALYRVRRGIVGEEPGVVKNFQEDSRENSLTDGSECSTIRTMRREAGKKAYTVRIPAQVLGSLLRVSRGRGMTGPGRVAEMILDRFQGEKGKGMAAIDGFEAISSQRYEPYGSASDWVPLNLEVDGDLLGEIAAASAWTGIRRLRIVPLILMGCRGRFYDLVETGTGTPRWQLSQRASTAVHREIRAGRMAVGPCEICGMKPEKVEGVQRIHAHHHLGYDEEHHLEVQWLCREHHLEAHNIMRMQDLEKGDSP